MASNLWRRQPAGRLTLDSLVARRPGETTPTIADDFFEPSATAVQGFNIWTGAAWTMKPVKWWDGSAWVVKPLKRWSGSAWV